jgi:dethiobiotin synthetase
VTAVFVTGTGTDVGKTFVTAGLIRHMRAAGRTVEAIKPLVSGFDPASAAESGQAFFPPGPPCYQHRGDQYISPWRFAAPPRPTCGKREERDRFRHPGRVLAP